MGEISVPLRLAQAAIGAKQKHNNALLVAGCLGVVWFGGKSSAAVALEKNKNTSLYWRPIKQQHFLGFNVITQDGNNDNDDDGGWGTGDGGVFTVCISCRCEYFRVWESLNSTSVEGSQPPGFSTDTEMKVKSSFKLYNHIVDIRYWFGHLV